MTPQLSVVIPSFNRRDTLLRLLDSLVVQSLGSTGFEVIVVLDGSSDGSGAAINGRQWPFSLRVIEQENAGAGAARNAGAAMAQGRILLFLDDDVVMEQQALEHHLIAADSVGAVAVIGHLTTVWRTAGIGSTNSTLWASLESLEDMQPVRFTWCYSGNLSLPAEGFRAIGGFDPALRRFEDCELGYRIDQLGMPLIYSRHAAGTQFNTKSSADDLSDAVATGTAAMKLFRTEPDFLAAIPTEPRRRPGRWTARLVEVACRIPVPLVLASALGRLPARLPLVRKLHNGVWQRWYLTGVWKEASGPAEFRAFLFRQ